MIVVGVDFSPGAGAALNVAKRLGAQWDQPVQLVHVEPALGRPIDRDAVAGKWLDARGLRTEDVEIRRGVPWVELVRAAREMQATLVVTGTHGRSGFQPVRLGTTAMQVALRAGAPVLLVPAEREAAEVAAGSSSQSYNPSE